MADLVTRIMLDNKQFDDNIKKSKAQLKQFENVTSMLSQGVTKFAGAIGLVVGAQEIFNSLIQSSQTLGDGFATVINKGKDSVSEFFYSIGSGDFSSFLNGLDSIIEKSAEATASLDQLGNTRMAYEYSRSQNRRTISEGKVNANNTNLSREEREAAFKVWERGLQELKQTSEAYMNDALQAATDLAEKGTLIDNVSIQNLDKILKLDVQNATKRAEEKKRLEDEYYNYKKGLQEIDSKFAVQKAKTSNRASIESIKEQEKAEKKKWAKQFEMAVMYNNLLKKKNDDELQSLYQIINEAENAKEELGSQIEEFNNAKRAFDSDQSTTSTSKSSNNNSVSVNVKPVFPSNSLAYLQQQISEKKLQYEMAVTAESRITLMRQLEELQAKKRWIEIEVKYNDSIAGKKLSENPINTGAYNPIKGNNSTQSILSDFKFPNLSEKPQKWADELTESLSGAAEGLMQLGNTFSVFSENAALGKSALIIGAIGQLVFSFSQAATKTVSPWEWLAFIMTGTATLASVIAQISSFETGGIVGGNSYHGDRNLIRVNSGEMILNKKQQNNLFNAIDKNQLGNNSNFNGQVEFKIQGKQLVGVLSNYNNKISKVL